MLRVEPRQKTFPLMNIEFEPKNETEEIYLEKLNDLLKNKRRGDWGDVAIMIGATSQQNAEKSFKRVFSKNHKKAVEALEKIINTRNQLLNN